MNDRDCESCKKFSRVDPLESEGYCDAKRTWVDPQEGEDCKMHEFTLHSATKYKDGTPIMSEPEKMCSVCRKTVKDVSNRLDHLERAFKGFAETQNELIEKYNATLKEFAKTQDELIEEYDATLKTHGNTLEDHMERITINEGNIDSISSDVEDLQRKVAVIYQFINSAAPGTFFSILEEFKKVEKENVHNGSDFCGNCTHCYHGKQGDDTIYICTLSHGFVDPDDSSCSHFEPPF